jgi:molecular chaperone DnaK
MREKIEALKQASYKLAEEMYKNAGVGAEGGAGEAGGAGPEEGAGGAGEGQAGGENVEDVDYEVVDEEEDENK